MTLSTRARPVLVHPLEVARILAVAVRTFSRYMGRRRQVLQLSEMPDYLLTDMGLRRDDISHALDSNWRDDPTYRLAVAASKRRRGLCD